MMNTVIITMLRILLILPAFLLITGCGSVSLGSEIAPESVDIVDDVEPEFSYINTRFGYALSVPDGGLAYALTQDQTAMAADEQSEVVFFVEEETRFFTIRGIATTQSPHEWITQHLSFFYPTGNASQSVSEFAGVQAIVLRGSGTADAPARLIVLRHGEHLLVILSEQDSAYFEALLEHFVLI